MIKSKTELKRYMACDRIALQIEKRGAFTRMMDPVYQYQKIMRKLDYYKNCASWNKIAFIYYLLRFRHMGIKLGFSIPCDVIGPGLCIAHYGNIVISYYTRIGNNCKIHTGVNIGATGGEKKAPVIGNNVYIGPGAKLIGNIEIADGVVIGANAVVTKSITEAGTYAGVPAKKINDSDSSKHLVRATEMIK